MSVYYKAVDGETLRAGAGLAAGANASAGGPSLTTDTDNTRCETPYTAVCPTEALPVHKKAVGGERLHTGVGPVAGANASALGRPSLSIHTIDTAVHNERRM